MKKFIYTTFLFTSAIAMFAIAHFASAAYSINSDPADCRTVTIANYTTGTGIGSPCWNGISVSASNNQTINVAIYFNNSGTTPANNVSLTLTDPRSQTFGSSSSVSFTGKIFVGGTLVKSGQVILNLNTSTDAQLVLSQVTRYNRSSGTDVPVSSGSDIFTSSGLNIGTLNPGWSNQSVVKVSFVVQTNTSNSCPSGYYWNGSVCVQSNNCPSGSYWNGSICIQNVNNNCPSGYYWNGSTCIQSNNCPTGYYWNGSTCIQTNNCPTGYYMSGGYCVPVQQTGSVPVVSTLPAISVGSTVAVVDGYYTSTGCSTSPSTYFNYGTTTGLGTQTSVVARTNATGPMATSISGLYANTTYYYQAVATNCAGTGYGTTQSFTTGGTEVVNPPVIIPITGSGSFIKLMITNNRDTVRQGREIPYDLSWENVSGHNLKDLVLEVNFPQQMNVTETERGQITRTGNSVVLNIPSLLRHEKGEMTIYTEIKSGLKNGDPVVAQAIMAFENPTTQAVENAIAYDADEFSGDINTFASLSFVEWLLLILIVLVVIVLVRYMTRKDYRHEHALHADGSDHAGAPHDHIVYRPTPKE